MLNSKNPRKELFRKLDLVLSVSQKKFCIENKNDHTRMKWGRLMVNAIQAYGKLLESAQIDELAKDVEEIKQKAGLT